MSLDKYETIFLCQIHFNSNNQEYKQLCILTRFYNLFKNQCRWSNGNDYCLRNSRFQVRVLVGTHLFRVTLFFDFLIFYWRCSLHVSLLEVLENIRKNSCMHTVFITVFARTPKKSTPQGLERKRHCSNAKISVPNLLTRSKPSNRSNCLLPFEDNISEDIIQHRFGDSESQKLWIITNYNSGCHFENEVGVTKILFIISFYWQFFTIVKF